MTPKISVSVRFSQERMWKLEECEIITEMKGSLLLSPSSELCGPGLEGMGSEADGTTLPPLPRPVTLADWEPL